MNNRRCKFAPVASDSIPSKPSESGDAPVKRKKRKRGRPRKQGIDEHDEAEPHMASFNSWLQSLPVIQSITPVKQEDHISLLSDTNPEFWDCVYPSYKELPSTDCMYNTLSEEDFSKNEDRQLMYLQENFINANLGAREDPLDDNESELSDSEEEVHRGWIDVYDCCVELDKADKMWDETKNDFDQNEEQLDVEVESVIGESTDLQLNVEKTTSEMNDYSSSPSASQMPPKEDKVVKQRSLCAYCDKFVPIKELTSLPFPTSSKLEEYLLCLSGDDAPLADRMRDDIGKWELYKICKRHAQKCPGRMRLTKNRVFVPDDAAIAKWRQRIKDDEDGRMMTFADATELGLSPMAVKRCFYCSQLCHHTVSYLCTKQQENSASDLDIWIGGLALGNEEVKSILRKNLYPCGSSPSRRYLCASHFRRSSFVISDSACRHIRLRKNEAPIGDKSVNDILLRRYTSIVENTVVVPDKAVFLEAPITVKKEHWNINILGEIVPLSENYYLDLPQTLADGTTIVTHRFCCGPNSEEMFCIACSVVRRDLVGIMSVRNPGLSRSSRKPKRLPSIMCLWISKNKEAIKMKMGEEQNTEFMKCAVAMWNDVDNKTKIEFLKERSKLSEEFSASEDDRISAANAISKLSPAGIVVRGDQLLTDVSSLEHICVQYHSLFSEAYITPIGYFPPELELLDYEKERLEYYSTLFKKLRLKGSRKRSLALQDAEDKTKKKTVTVRLTPLKTSEDLLSPFDNLKINVSKWLKCVRHDHCYAKSRIARDIAFEPLILDVNAFPAISFVTQTSRKSNITSTNSLAEVSTWTNAVESPVNSLAIYTSKNVPRVKTTTGDSEAELEKSAQGSSEDDTTDERNTEIIAFSPSECHTDIKNDAAVVGSESTLESPPSLSAFEKVLDDSITSNSTLPEGERPCGFAHASPCPPVSSLSSSQQNCRFSHSFA